MSKITGRFVDNTIIHSDGSAPFTADQPMGSNKLTGLADGTAANDAVNKGQLDAAIDGLSWKDPVTVATTANITLSGEQTIDGILTSTSRVLVKNQTDPTENGLYLSAAGAWSRTSDADTGPELEGAAVLVQQGTTQADEKYTQTADNITIGVTNIVWVLFDSGTGVTASNGLEKVGSDIRVKGPGQGLEIGGGGDLQATDAVVAAQEWGVAILTLDGTDITNAFKDIAGETVRAGQATRVELTPVGGPEQEYTVDFTVINDGGAVLRRVNWSGLGLDGVLISGDKLIVRFPSA